MTRLRPSPFVFALLVAFAFSLLYSLTAAQTFSYDSITMALAIETGPLSNVFPAAHMIWAAAAWLAFHIVLALGQGVRSLLVQQWVNAAIGGLAVGFFFWILNRDFRWKRALLGAALLGISHSMWSECVDPGAYAWAALASAGVLYLLVSGIDRSGFFIGATHGLTVLAHQMLVLAAPALLLRLSRPKRLSYLAGLGSVIGSAYIAIVLIFHGGSVPEGLLWAFGPAGWPEGRPMEIFHWWSVDLPSSLVKTAYGMVRAWVAYIGTRSHNGVIVESGLAVAAVMIVVFAVWQIYRRRDAQKYLLMVLSFWIVAMELFFLVYVPGTPRFQLLCLPPVIYAAWMIEDRRLGDFGFLGLALVAIGLGAYNFSRSIRPSMILANNHSLVRILTLNRVAHSGDFFLFGGTGDSIVNIYMPYFGRDLKGRSLGGYFFERPEGDLREVRAVIDQVRKAGGRLFVEAQVYEPEFVRRFEQEHRIPAGKLQSWIKALGTRKERLNLEPSYGVYHVI